MEAFAKIYQRAVDRKGGEAALQERLPEVKNIRSLSRLNNDQVLAEVAKCVFQAGFVWKVIEQKWPGFERAFHNFDVVRIAHWSPEELEALAKNPEIVRNMQKIVSVQKNSQFILSYQGNEKNFAQMLVQWPKEELIECFKYLKKNGSRLGGMTGPRVLRNLGIDTFLLTADVIKCLQLAGVEISDTGSSQRDLKAAQEAFNQWQQESGFSYAHLSRVCACSVGDGDIRH